MPNIFLEPFVYNGVIYSLLFGSLGIFAFVQIILSFLGYKDKTRRHYTRKIWFHVLLALFGLFECVYAVSLILNNGYSRWGLVMHTIALYLHVLLFALIINFWKLSLNDVSPSAVFGVVILSLNGVVTVVTVIAICE
jgi:hypothetical protein